jgi:phospholipid/cholesterol/gamma-HCH transport system substrate-binding protein
MAAGTNHWKLGLFVLVGGALSAGIVVWLGAGLLQEEMVEYTSYFDESIQGLAVGSPVSFRGVDVGRVSALGVAPDTRHVSVTTALDVETLNQFNPGKNQPTPELAVKLLKRPEVRVQLAQTGITGVKFILIDYFDPATTPVEPLDFKLPENYLPSVPSTLKQLEASVVDASEQLPELTRRLSETIFTVNGIALQIEQSKLPDRAVATLDQTSLAMRQLNQQLAAIDAAALSDDLRHTLGSVNATLGRVDVVLDAIGSDEGVLHSIQGSMSSLGEVARGAQSFGPEMGMTLREVRSAARSIKRLADALETDPDMLLKGRAVAGP